MYEFWTPVIRRIDLFPECSSQLKADEIVVCFFGGEMGGAELFILLPKLNLRITKKKNLSFSWTTLMFEVVGKKIEHKRIWNSVFKH